MKSMKKMLAAVMVLAVAFAGVVILDTSEEDDATSLTINWVNNEYTNTESITVAASDDLTIPNGKVYINNGTITNNGTISIEAGGILINNGTITNNRTITNNGTYVVGAGSTNPYFSQIGGTIQTDMMGLENTINADTKIDGEAYLRNDLIIPEGKTLTISNSGSLEMQGKTITVYGKLVIDTRGVIIGTGSIVLMKDGVIDNSGLIGKSGAVTISSGSINGKYTGAGSVAIQNVSGIEFDLKKISTGNYVLAISGEASKKTNTENAVYTVASTGAYVDSNLLIKTDVTLSGNITLSKGTLMINGTYNDEDGIITMKKGSILEVNGSLTGKVQANTGEYISSGSIPTGVTGMEADKVTGILVEVTSVSYVKDNAGTPTSYTEQRLVISGDIKSSDKNSRADIDVKKVDGESNYFGIYVTGEASLDNISFSVDQNSYATILGKVTAELDSPYSEFTDLGQRVIGAIYQTEIKSDSGSKTYIVTMEPFDAAYSVIDSTYEKIIYVFGNVTISDELEIKDGWTIDGVGVYNIKSTGMVTVNDGAELKSKTGDVYDQSNNQIGGIIVDGILIVKDGGSITGTVDYSAKTTDSETGDVTYSGFLVALNNAPEGSVVEVSKNTTVGESFTIPANKTVKVKDGVTLTAQKNIIVEGTLVSTGTVNVTGETSVSGKMDLYESTSTLTGKITVTGEILFASAYSGTNMNAVYIQNDDGQYVYTTIAKAVGIRSTIDNSTVTITQVGKVSDLTPVTLEKTTLAITGEAVFGEITLKKSTVTATGTTNVKLTATLIGAYGEDGSQAETRLILKDVYRSASFASTSTANEMNVQVWKTTICYGNGSVTVDNGQAETNIPAQQTTAGFSTTALKVSSGAILVMKNDVTVDQAKNLVIEGTAIIDANVTISATDFVVAGNLLINPEKSLRVTGTMTVEGTLTVSEKDNKKATFTIGNTGASGRVNVGATPKTLGAASGTIDGIINIAGTGYIVVYPGAVVDADKIVESDVAEKSTTFVINGITYATVYGNTNMACLNTEIVALSDLNVPYDTTTRTYTIEWYADGTKITDVSAVAIGNYDSITAKIDWKTVDVIVSAGPGLEIYVDDVYMNGDVDLSVGEHTITVYVKAGYEGTPKITFNGQEITNGKFTLTSAAIGEKNVVYATGATPAVTPAPTPTPTPVEPKDDSMGITEYLLIVLVILAAILVVVVAIRMMRS